jgi:hypothetical protein
MTLDAAELGWGREELLKCLEVVISSHDLYDREYTARGGSPSRSELE